MNLLLVFFIASLASATPPPDDGVYPDAAFSRPQVDRLRTFETGVGVECQPQLAEAPAEFQQNALTLRAEGPSVGSAPFFTQWKFTRAKGAGAQPRLGISERLRHVPTAVSFNVINRSPRAISLSVQLDEMPWHAGPQPRTQTWGLGPNRIIAPGQEKTLTFTMAEARPLKDDEKRTTPVCPLLAIAIQTNGIEDDVPYDLEFRALTVEYPAPPLAITQWRVPASVKPDQPLCLSWQMTGDVRPHALSLELRRGDWVLWRTPLTKDAAAAATVELAVPWYLAGETLTPGLVADGYRIPENAPASITIESASEPEFPRVERRTRHGLPGVFVNGKPFSWNGYASYDYQPGPAAEFGKSGINVFCIPTCAGRHIHHPVSAPTWIAPDEWDFGQVDERVGIALQANPDAMVMLRISMALPPFLLQQMGAEAQTLVQTAQGPMPWQETGCPAVPVALEAWRTAQKEALVKLLRYCKTRPWAPRLMGMWLTGEVTEEWFSWACNNSAYADYSEANTRGFREWAHARGWNYDTVPAMDVRKQPGWDLYPPNVNGKQAAAYAQYNSDITAETIEYFAKAAKEETQGRLLVGAFYGYVLQIAGESRQHTSGHFALRRLLDSPYVDAFGGIPLFEGRVLQDGYATDVSATQSIQRAGKLYMNENDLFSYRHPLIWYTEYDPENPLQGAITMHRRVFASDAVHGLQRQWFGLMASWHHDADLQDAFAQDTALNKQLRTADRHPMDEIAFMVDDTSFAWTPPDTMLLQATNKALLLSAAKTGAPVGVWLLSDIDRLPDRIKFVIVAQAYAAKPTDIAKLEHCIRKGGKAFLLIGPVGLVNPDTQQWDSAATARITGLAIDVQEQGGSGVMHFRDSQSPACSIASLRPRTVAQHEGQMRYADGVPASAERPLAKNGRLIWCGVPPLDIRWLRQVLDAAEVHAYAPEGYSVHASHDLVSVTATKPGDADLHWKSAVLATDLLSGWTQTGQTFSCPFQTGQTRLFRIRPSADRRN